MSLSVERTHPINPSAGFSPNSAFTRRLGVIAATATFLMLLAMTIGTALGAKAVLSSQSEQRFADVVEGASNSVRADFDRSFTEIASMEAFIRSDPGVTNDQFKLFAGTMSQRGTGAEALGFAPKVRAPESATFISDMRNQGISLRDFSVDSVASERYPVAYMFPPLPGLVDPGLNILGDPRFGTAVQNSLYSDAPVASAPIQFQTNPSGPPWFLVFQPVFGDPAPGLLPSEGPLLGYVFGVYRAADFLGGPLERNSLDGVPFKVFDRSEGRDPILIFPELSTTVNDKLLSGWVQADVEFAGRRWIMQFETPEQFGLSGLERNVWVIVLSAGLGLTVFASVSMFSLLKARSAAHSDLDLMTSQIRVIIGSAIEGIVVMDALNRLVWANRSFAEAFGMPDPEVLAGKDWSAVRESAGVDLADRDGFFNQMGQISGNRDVVVTRSDVRITGPAEKTLSMSSSPVSDQSGHYLGRLFVFRDVTVERSAEEAKTDFISMVSHELRTPLTSIVGYVDLLMEGAGGPQNSDSMRLLGAVRRNGNRLARLVADILDLSRIDNARFDLELSDVDVPVLINDIVESMSADFKSKEQSVTLEIEEQVPAIRADRVRLGQVITNLLSNAYRYTPVGGNVMVRAAERNGDYRISVQDTGIGIRSEDMPRLFQRFARIHRNGPRPSGSTGLGLAITKALVELHGGTIEVESDPNSGSTFTVTIPITVRNKDAA